MTIVKPEKKYNLMFENINKDAIIAVKGAIKTDGLFRAKTLAEKEIIIQQLHNNLCAIYELPLIELVYIKNYFATGQYNNLLNKIILNKPSLVTYLHEFCHFKNITKHQKNSEDIARGWSISLFYLATPKLCIKAINSGKIIHQSEIETLKEFDEVGDMEYKSL